MATAHSLDRVSEKENGALTQTRDSSTMRDMMHTRRMLHSFHLHRCPTPSSASSSWLICMTFTSVQLAPCPRVVEMVDHSESMKQLNLALSTEETDCPLHASLASWRSMKILETSSRHHTGRRITRLHKNMAHRSCKMDTLFVVLSAPSHGTGAICVTSVPEGIPKTCWLATRSEFDLASQPHYIRLAEPS